jgi:hypothetical protein
VLCGFTLEEFGDDTWVAFGDHGSKVSIVRINKVTNARRRRECGFKFIECEIGEVIDNPDMRFNDLEAIPPFGTGPPLSSALLDDQSSTPFW